MPGTLLLMLLLYCQVYSSQQLRLRHRPQPKIITADGNLNIQSATNRNITFEVDSEADILFGETSLKALVKKLEDQENEIKKLKENWVDKKSCNSVEPRCSKHGICIDTVPLQSGGTGFKCLCQPGYTGDTCSENLSSNLCSALKCENGGNCSVLNGLPVCICQGKWFGKHCTALKPIDCTYNVTETAGVINSPGYPDLYPSNIRCSWWISVKPTKRIRFIVAVASIGNSTDCEKTDYLLINDYNERKMLCGYVQPQTFFSRTNEVNLVFSTGKKPVGYGFNIFYAEVDNDFCGGHLTGASGKLTSSTDDNRSVYCTWVIDTNDTIKVSFKQLIIKNQADHCLNYLEIREGDSVHSPLYRKICNSDDDNMELLTAMFLSKVFIRFVSNGRYSNSLVAKYETVCGGNVHLDNNILEITSPGFPFGYPLKKRCVWKFTSFPGTIISIKFTDFEFEHHPSCNYDYISVHNGLTITSPQLGIFCGDRTPFPISSSSNEMTIVLNTDASNGFRGFKAQLKAFTEGCGGTYMDTSGSISSPDPEFTSPIAECVYSITSKNPVEIVQLTFTSVSLKQSNDCEDEYLQIFDGDTIQAPLILVGMNKEGKLCETSVILPTVIMSTGRSLTVKFKKNGTSSLFSGDWLALPSTAGCNVYKTSSSGEISSPYYPNFYSPDSFCTYTIEAMEGHLIRLEFDDFDLENMALQLTCSSDYLEIYDGDNVTSPLLGRLCGHSPGTIVSSGSYLYLIFKSDSSIQKKGFHATYTTGTGFCGGSLHTAQGFILSPNYPRMYSANMQCEWEIIVMEGNRIELTIEELLLELSPACKDHDSLEIFDVHPNNGLKMPIVTVCGNVSSRVIQSKGHSLFLKFKSDDSIQEKGFKLSYKSGCGGIFNARRGAITSPNFPRNYPLYRNCKWTIMGHVNDRISLFFKHFELEEGEDCGYDYLEINGMQQSYGKFCGNEIKNITSTESQLSLTFSSDGDSSYKGFSVLYEINGCSEDFFSSNGTFTTPNYPQRYPANSYCKWRIRVKEGMKIRLKIANIHLESDCIHDNVTIYNGYSENFPQIGSYCSRRQNITLESSMNELTVLFRSDVLISGKGFIATYSAVEGGCGGTLLAHSGNIHSPGYPNNYPSKTVCEWVLEVPQNNHIQLTFKSFEIESTSNCSFDYLAVTDLVTGTSLGKFCGRNVSDSIVSSGNKMSVLLYTDSATNGKGFYASYELGCGGVRKVNHTAGYITSPHYPQRYSPVNCTWQLMATPGEQITLTFQDFNLQKCNNCNCDYVKIYDGDSAVNLVGQYCGSSVPHSITSTGNHLFIKFTADGIKQYPGFKAKYTSFPAACGGHVSGVEGAIVSPLFPLPSSANANCLWRIEVSPGNVISLSFDEFDLVETVNCSVAYIQVYDGEVNNDLQLMKECGSAKPVTLKSTKNIITVRFFSRGNVRSNGFKAVYKSDCSGRIITDESGYIASPNYPSVYPANTICSWFLIAPKGVTFSVSFEYFELEESIQSRCNDFIQLLDGEDLDRHIGTWCGADFPPPITTFTNVLGIGFYTDLSIEHRGFLLKYEMTKKPVIECGGTLMSTAVPQYITSPNYPNRYPSNEYCLWEIKAPLGYSVSITFLDFVLEEFERCPFDYVKIVEKDVFGQERSLSGVLCTDITLNRTFVSTEQTVLVQFVSDSSTELRGFNASYMTVCGATMTATKGLIKSQANEHGKYFSNVTCEWKIIVTEGSQINLMFTKFSLQASNKCESDYVVIKNGRKNDSPIIGQYCGFQIPANITSSSHEVLVQFVTDRLVNKDGFELVYEQVVPGCGSTISLNDPTITYELNSPNYPDFSPTNLECDWTITVPSGNVIDFSFIDFELPSSHYCFDSSIMLFTKGFDSQVTFGPFCADKKPALPSYHSVTNVLHMRYISGTIANKGFKATLKIGCGGYFHDISGSIISPSFPENYADNLDCTYLISLPTRKQVHLSFKQFSIISNNTATCDEDFIEIRNGDGHNTLIGRYCGNVLPPTIVSASNKLYIRFHSNANGSSSGFQAFYDTVGTKCGNTLSVSGILASPYHPRMYPLNRMCSWTLEGIPGLSIDLNFTSFDLVDSVNCSHDYVEVRNGLTIRDPLIGRYCGKREAFNIQSSGDGMHVTFVSDHNSNRGAGFKASFDSVHKGCGGFLHGSSGNITSPNYPQVYPTAVECIWVVSVPKDRTIHLKVSDFELEESLFCDFDYVEIRDGSLSTSPLLGKICENSTIGNIYSAVGSTMYIKFFADDSAQAKGFYLSWYEGPPGCGGTFSQSTGEILSPNYPGPYESNLDCEWLIYQPSGTIISMNIKEFDLHQSVNCSRDRILFQNGEYGYSPVFATLCGTNLASTTYNSSGNYVRVRMQTGDVNETYSGFRISYSTRALGCGGFVTGINGTVTSPGYPSFYGDNLDCEWIIQTEAGSKVFVYIDDLDLDSFRTLPTGCEDFVELRDHILTTTSQGSSSVDEPLIAKLCGKRHDSIYESSQNIISVRLRTNAFLGGRGFKLNFNTGCGGVIKGRSGYAKSPNYPLTYPINQDCEWVVDLESHYHVKMIENEFKLPPSNAFGECSDFVELRAGLDMTAPLISKLCGSSLPSTYDTSYHQLHVRFVSDNITDVGEYRVKTHIIAACGERIKDSLKGVIQLLHEREYNHEEECEWVIEFPVGKQISLVSKSFSLELGGSSCSYDYVEIRDGGTKDSPLFGRFCGVMAPPALRSTGNLLYIKFKSDHSLAEEGFQFEYSEAALRCGGSFNETRGQITSPNYPGDVPINVDCGWRIEVPFGQKINLTFSEFNLANLPLIAVDPCARYIYIYDSIYPDDHFRRTKQLCGDVAPQPIISFHNHLYIRFHSSSVPAGTGNHFVASYQTVQGCGGKLQASRNKTELRNPSYLVSGINCDWLILGPEGEQIRVNVQQFRSSSNEQRCQSSHLAIIDGILTDREHNLCNDNDTIDFTSTGPLIRLSFKQMFLNESFVLTYESVNGCNQTYTASSGLITSPNYPLNYNAENDCTYLIEAPIGQTISLYAVAFHVEYFRKCVFDYLNIYDGGVISSSNLFNNQSYCGDILPPSFHSTGNIVRLRFKSDRSIARSGFSFLYTASETVCRASLSGPEGSFTSPNFPSFYGGSLSCEWNITVSSGKRVQLNVTHFELQFADGARDCATVDYLEMFDRYPSVSWGKFCGLDHPAPRISTSNQVTVKFISNAANNRYNGFRLVYKEVF